ncbi:MAG: hypothetical protein B6D64_01635 [Bacteroidetes bacterium 4484_276]|nr:MAG: hypothetical protein B6D64_01635 [Bacteroidetes bacterium 4484_276]OYT14077.1 MAG: hypothetical protein B6I19_01765 [Bacteroidetes bacterium 4572_114]
MERKIAKGFLTIKDSLSVLLIQPGYIYKTNAKTWEIENFEDLSGWVQDSILYDKSLFIKEVDDSIFFEKYFSGLQNGLINLGITVFNQDRIVDFMNVKGTAFQVAVVQLELEEDIYPYRAEEIFDDTVAYYEDFNLNTVNVNNWYEITKLNDPLAINNLLYASHYVMDELEGRFANNIFTGEVKFKYNLTPMDVNKIYNLAQMLGEKYAGYVFDYMLNEHVYRNIGNHVRPGTYFHYDPQIKTLYPAGADRFIFLDN